MLSDARAQRILASAATSTDVRRGGNSRVTCVVEGGVEYAVKDYRQRSDGVARLQREQMALGFLFRHLPDAVPSPMWHSESLILAIHSWLPGTRPALDRASVEGLLARFEDLRGLMGVAEEGGVPPAVDAIRHEGELSDQIFHRCRALSANHRLPLGPWVDEVLSGLQNQAGNRPRGEGSDRAVLTVSPSDAGPHNLLQDPLGLSYRMVDWEFFGIDDAHKLVGDSILHPQTTWSSTLLDGFLQSSVKQFPLNLGRLERLLPLLSLKWATIALARAARFAGASEEAVENLDVSPSSPAGLAGRYLRLARERDLDRILALVSRSNDCASG